MKFWIGVAVAFAAAAATAAFVGNEYFFFAGYTVLMFVMLATAWNILGGYAGYVNFGTPAFFGLGAYTAAVLYKAFALPLALQIVAAAVMSGLLGLVAGLLTLRLRGIFFAIATIALGVIMETLFINWRYAGGATGLQLLRPPLTPPFESYIEMLFLVMVVMVLASIAIARYIDSPTYDPGRPSSGNRCQASIPKRELLRSPVSGVRRSASRACSSVLSSGCPRRSDASTVPLAPWWSRHSSIDFDRTGCGPT